MPVPSIEITLAIDSLDAGTPAGTVRRNGREQPFSGWLGLIAAIETLAEEAAGGAGEAR